MNPNRLGNRAETALRDILMARGYLCIRSAASKVLDLVCFGPSDPYGVGIEVKASKTDVVRASRTKRQKEQHEELMRMPRMYHALSTMYAVRWADDSYELFDPTESILRRGGGYSLEVEFPDLRYPPSNPPIVPPGSTPQVVAVVPRAEVKGSWHLEPGGDAL